MPLDFQIILNFDFKSQVHKNSTEDVLNVKKFVKLFMSDIERDVIEERDGCCEVLRGSFGRPKETVEENVELRKVSLLKLFFKDLDLNAL